MSGPTFSTHFFLQILKNAHHGTVRVTLPDRRIESFGVGEPHIDVLVRDWKVFDQLVSRGDLGLAEAIMEDQLVVSDTVALIQWACLNDQSLNATLHGTWLGTFASQVKKILAFNSRRGAKKNIETHYDLGNEFYRLWLDKTMTYSSGIFESPDQDLSSAQLAKYDRLIDQLNIKPSDHILEIGCGWGGFFSRAVERTGCKVTAVMNSPSQARHNRELISAKGYNQNVDLQEKDYRDIDGKYDKIVSIEMIEAIGESHWKTYFNKLSSSLKHGGAAMIQGITIREDLFYSYRKQTDFIQQYVFPGGMLLTNKAFTEHGQRNQMLMAPVYEFGSSYADTLKLWRKNFKNAEAHVLEMGFDQKFIRLWDLYLAYCEGAFRAGRINVGQFHMQTV